MTATLRIVPNEGALKSLTEVSVELTTLIASKVANEAKDRARVKSGFMKAAIYYESAIESSKADSLAEARKISDRELADTPPYGAEEAVVTSPALYSIFNEMADSFMEGAIIEIIAQLPSLVEEIKGE